MQAGGVLGAQADYLFIIGRKLCRRVFCGVGQIIFVENGQRRTALTFFRNGHVLGGEGRAGVKHRQHQTRLLQLAPAAADALRLNFIGGLMHTGGVKEVEPYLPQLHRLLHDVPCGARHRRDDGPFEPGQQIEQRGLAHVGPAQQHAVHPVAQHRPRAVAVDEVVQPGFLGGERFGEVGGGQLRHVLLRVIHPGGEVGVEALQCGLDGADALCQRAAQRRLRQRRPLPPVGGDDLHHRLRLRQRQAAVLQRAAGELPRPGRSCACVIQRLQQGVCHHGAAMHRQFHHILAGVAAGGAEAQRHRFVQRLPF